MLKKSFLSCFSNHDETHLLALARKTKQLEFQLTHDRLTGLKNRYALEEAIKNHFTPILLVDIDEFHHYNELYGIEVGNEVLQNFAKFLDEFAQKHAYDTYRIYGDGFILKSQLSSKTHDVIYEDIITFLEELAQYKMHIEIEEETVWIEVNTTIAISMEKRYVLEKANIALKHARVEQKDFLAYYHALNTEKKLQDTLYWRKEIKEAIKDERMIPVFQPIVNQKGEILKYEVLTRLKQVGINGITYISPVQFLDIAIKTKQYRHITRAIIKNSFSIMKNKEVDFSINLLFSDIKNRKTMQYLKEQIIYHDIGSRLVLEIVESEDIKDYKLLKSVIGRFRDLGVRIAIDDFGSGFSNYAYILEIAPDYLKIDGSLIKEIDRDKNAYKLVSSIQTLASSLSIKTIAEYIHSKEVFDVCQALGIDEFQGYYFSEPLAANALQTQETKALSLSSP
jgi:diguanylate cyclase (GGDEF)-like protein